MTWRRQALVVIGAVVCAAALWSVLGQDYMNQYYREVEPSKPFYLDRKSDAWQGRTRIVGVLRNPPAKFTIAIINELTMQPVRTETHSGAFTVYETQWLPPGRYELVFAAEGFLGQHLRGVQLKAGTDCFINLFFNPRVYKH